MQFNIIDVLYFMFIFPLQTTMGLVLGWLFGVVKSQGLSIIFLSVLVNICLLKIYIFTDVKAKRFGALKTRCDSKIAEFKRVFKGAELQSYIRTLYKQRHYHPIFALSALGGLAVQVPFFIAALCLLQDLDTIKGVPFLWISDLSAPDSVFGVHILPILMTIISLINVWIVAKDRGAKIQGIAIALIFLVLLYNMPSALVLYWTTNMAFSLIRAVFAKMRKGAESNKKNASDSANQTKIAESSLDSATRTQNPPDSANLAESSIKSKLYNLFNLHKFLKISAISLTALLVFLLCATFALMLYMKDNLQTAPLVLENSNEASIQAQKWNFLLRSNSVSIVEIIGVEWASEIDASAIEIVSNQRRFVHLKGANVLSLENGANMGQISYMINLMPLFKNVLKGCFVVLGVILLLYVISKFQKYEQVYAPTYRRISCYAILCIAFLICVFSPYQLYSTDITQFDAKQTFATLSALFGVFALVSFVAIYATSFIPKRFSNFTAFILSLILFSGIAYSFVLVGDYGAMDRFVFQKELLPFNDPKLKLKQFAIFVAIAFIGIMLFAFVLKKVLRAWQIILLTLFVVSGVNATNIIIKRADSANSAESSPKIAESNPKPYQSELFSYSKTQKNVVVIVLDMFSGSHIPYILEQFPQFKSELDGFTHFPNAVSSSNATFYAMPAVAAGEHYTIYNMNARKDNRAKSEANAYKQVALSFANEGYAVGYFMYRIAGRDELIAESSIFWLDNGEAFKQYFLAKHPKVAIKLTDSTHFDIAKMINFGFFKFMPEIYFRNRIYNRNLHLQNQNADSNTAITHIAPFYSITHIGDTNATKPTFKFFHNFITHAPYGIYYDGKCNYLSKQTIWENKNPHKPSMEPGRYSYQHFDTEVCALSFLSNYIKWLKSEGIYDNTQIIVVSDHAGDDSLNMPKLAPRIIGADVLFLVKDFGASGELKIDMRLVANYDISSIFCSNLKNGCPNIKQNILTNYPHNRAIIHARPNDNFNHHKPNEWLISKAYKVHSDMGGGGIYDPQNWIDISDSKYGIVNFME